LTKNVFNVPAMRKVVSAVCHRRYTGKSFRRRLVLTRWQVPRSRYVLEEVKQGSPVTDRQPPNRARWQRRWRD